MQFNSVDFMIFFPVVIAVYFVMPRRGREAWLLICSYWFYMSWNALYAVLIMTSTLLTYGSGIVMARFSGEENRGKRKIALIICITVNLAILVVFKYGNFAIETAESLLRLLHVSVSGRRLDLLLPVGISFYTFQALGYSIDVYRGDVDAEKSLIRYALFVSFFPQLVAGPIERSKSLLSQMRKTAELHLWDVRRVTSGAILMVWGFFLKMVIADRAALLADTVFDRYRMYGGTEILIAAVFFSIQIYCDFGSYSTIAAGAAKILGFDLMENFNTPYFARNIRDFWNRWHISLSTWFRDYLYIPLGGNRGGNRKKMFNLVAVFLISGLWHGASFHFIAWGAVHGFYQVAADLLESPRKKLVWYLRIRTELFSFRLLQRISTYALVVAAWIFFRADSVFDALRCIRRIVFFPSPWVLFDGSVFVLGLDAAEMAVFAVAVMILFLVDLVRYTKGMTIDRFLMSQNLWFEWFCVIVLIAMIFVYGKYGPGFDPQQFIYFQF